MGSSSTPGGDEGTGPAEGARPAARPSSPRRTLRLILSCEHGGNRVPGRFASLFAGEEARTALQGHRGWDPGALDLARALRRATGAPLLHSTVTRLLVDPNRSPSSRAVFSGYTRSLPPEEKALLLRRYHAPHRGRVEDAVRNRLSPRGPVIHVSVHSFTSVIDGRPREVDVGLLYDPGREAERELCRRWLAALRDAFPALRVRANRPYRGTSDGLTTALRRAFDGTSYVGVELEVSQALLGGAPAGRRALHRAVVRTLLDALTD